MKSTVLWLVVPAVLASLGVGSASEVGTTEGRLRVDRFGEAAYTIPVAVPPGINGMAPELALRYSSADGPGTVAYGWNIGGISKITRCATNVEVHGVRGGVDMDDNDAFCLDGKLLMPTGNLYSGYPEYYTRAESWMRIIAKDTSEATDGPEEFEVWTKGGRHVTYSDGVKTVGPGAANAFAQWSITTAEDTFGNSIDYTYVTDAASGHQLPSSIEYNGNKVEFVHVDRTDDTAKRYVAGGSVEMSKRISEVNTYTDGGLVRTYVLDTSDSDTPTRTYLDAVTEYDASDNNLPATTFDYLPDAPPGLNATLARSGWEYAGNDNAPHHLLDVNGNGAAEIVAFAEDGIQITPGTPGGLPVEPYTVPVLRGTDGWNEAYYPRRFGDINGDGLPEAVGFNAGGVYVVLNDLGGLVTSATKVIDGYGRDDGWEDGGDPRFVTDINGDGRADIVGFKDGALHASLSLSTYSISGADVPGTITTDYITSFQPMGDPVSTWAAAGNETHKFLIAPGDFNGDGRTDFVAVGGSGSTARVVLSSSTDLVASFVGNIVSGAESDWGGPSDLDWDWQNETLDNYQGVPYFADVNGDGKTDLVLFGRAADRNKVYVSLSTGKSFEPLAEWSAAIGPVNYSSPVGLTIYNRKAVVDVNRDGLADLVGFNGSGTAAALSTGHGFGQVIVLQAGSDFAAAYDADGVHPLVGDINGDGHADVVRINYVGGADTFNYALQAVANVGARKLNAVTNGLGITTIVEYAYLTDSSVHDRETDAVYPVRTQATPRFVVSERRQDDGVGGQFVNTYFYTGERYNAVLGKSYGFRTVRANDSTKSTHRETFYDQSDPRTAGLPTSIDRRPDSWLSGALVHKALIPTIVEYDGGTRYYTYISESVESSRSTAYGGDSPWFLSVTDSIVSIDSCGNPQEREVYNDDRTGRNLDVVVSTTTNTTYQTNSPFRCLPSTSTTTISTTTAEGLTETLQKIAAFYPNGKLQLETVEPLSTDESIKTTTGYLYGSDGLLTTTVLTSTDVDAIDQTPVPSRSSTISSRDDHGFVNVMSNAMGHVLLSTTDPAFGVPLTTTDANGLTTTNVLNGFGAIVETHNADGTWTEIIREWCDDAEVDCGTFPDARQLPVFQVRKQIHDAVPVTQSLPEAITIYDGLGRALRTITKDFNGNDVYTDTVYNGYGRAEKVSRPYLSYATPQWTITSSFDVLDRPLVVDPPGDAYTTFTYDGFIKTVTDANDHTTTTETGVLGQVLSVTDAATGVIEYTYAPTGGIKTITNKTDPLNPQVTTFTYDKLGRQLSIDDPDTGLTTTTYYAFGGVRTTTDELGSTASFSYDKLNRQTASSTQEGLTTWTYDYCGTSPAAWCASGSRGVGQLHSMSGPDSMGGTYTEVFTYDELGRPILVDQTVEGKLYQTSTFYETDGFGRVWMTQYPGGNLTVENVYDPVTQFLTDIRNASTGEVFWSQLSDTPTVTEEIFGNNVVSKYTRDALTGRVTDIETTIGPVVVQDLSYEYDGVGNVELRSDNRLGQTETFLYDELDRLRFATSPGTYGALEWTYNGNGNIKTGSDVGTYHYDDPAHPHAVTSISGSVNNVFTYDALGRQVGRSGNNVKAPAAPRIIPLLPLGIPAIIPISPDNLGGMGDVSIAYTSFGKPSAVRATTNTVRFGYTPTGTRLLRKTATDSTLYLGAYQVEKSHGVTRQKHYIAGGRVVYTVSSDGSTATQYLHTDTLGSITAITNEAGAVVERNSYDPFGKRRNLDWSSATLGTIMSAASESYTGHKHEDELGLVYMKARMYDPLVGRFISADSILPDAFNTQELNPYSYCRNNPLRYIDPKGHSSWWNDFWDNVQDIRDDIVDEIERWEDGLNKFFDDNNINVNASAEVEVYGNSQEIYVSEEYAENDYKYDEKLMAAIHYNEAVYDIYGWPVVPEEEMFDGGGLTDVFVVWRQLGSFPSPYYHTFLLARPQGGKGGHVYLTGYSDESYSGDGSAGQIAGITATLFGIPALGQLRTRVATTESMWLPADVSEAGWSAVERVGTLPVSLPVVKGMLFDYARAVDKEKVWYSPYRTCNSVVGGGLQYLGFSGIPDSVEGKKLWTPGFAIGF